MRTVSDMEAHDWDAPEDQDRWRLSLRQPTWELRALASFCMGAAAAHLVGAGRLFVLSGALMVLAFAGKPNDSLVAVVLTSRRQRRGEGCRTSPSSHSPGRTTGRLDPSPDTALFDTAAFASDMEDLLGSVRRVDVTSSRVLDPVPPEAVRL